MKKHFATILASLCAAQGAIHAVDNQYQKSSDICCPLPGTPLDPCCSFAIYPYPAKPNLCWDVYARGSFLYWTASFIDITGIALEENAEESQFIQLYDSTQYRPGFEVGAGVDLGPVVLDFDYLRMHYHHTTNLSSAPGSVLVPQSIPTDFGGVIFPTFTSAQSHYTYNLDDARVTLQSPVYFSKRLVVTAGYGIDFQWTEIKWRRNYSNPAILANIGNFTHQTKYWGVGPTINLDLEGLLFGGAKMIGGLAFALDYYRYTKLDSTSQFPGASPTSFANFVQHGEKQRSGYSPMGNMELGLGWEGYLVSDQIYVDLTASYEFYAKWAGGQIFESVTYGSPFFHGLKVQGRIDF